MWSKQNKIKLKLYELWKTVEAEFYNIKTRLYLGLFSVKILLLPSFALAAIWLSNLGLLHGCKRAHCDKGGEGAKIPKTLTTWFMDGPLGMMIMPDGHF